MTAKSIHQKRIFDSEDNLQSMYMYSSKVFPMAKYICIVSCVLISLTVLKWRHFAFGPLLFLLPKTVRQTRPLLIWCAKQTFFVLYVAVNFCLLQPETHNDKRKRPDSAVIDMGDTIIKNVPFMFYDIYCKCVDVFKLTLLNKCFCLVQCEKYFLSKIYTTIYRWREGFSAGKIHNKLPKICNSIWRTLFFCVCIWPSLKVIK